MVFIGLIQDEMRNLKLLSAGKHKVRVSTKTKIYVSQDTTSTSLSHSLREMDCKQRPPGTTNTSKPVPASSDVEQELTRASGDAERNSSRPSTASSAQSAAAFFGNISPRSDSSILEACESIDRLNQYLNHRKADVRAGVPGQFLHAVIGQAVADVGSVVSTIACAFFLNQTQTSSHHCVLPVINTKRQILWPTQSSNGCLIHAELMNHPLFLLMRLTFRITIGLEI
ncbi:unnamed protein product [Musa textilis]